MRFTYNKPQIISAVLLSDIIEYLQELGCMQESEFCYKLDSITINISLHETEPNPFLSTWHKIDVLGNKGQAEEFLSAFRLRFLTMGG